VGGPPEINSHQRGYEDEAYNPDSQLQMLPLSIVPEHLYPWLGIGPGITIALLGLHMLRRLLSHPPSEGPLVNRWLPMASATVITCLGIGMIAQALLAVGVIHVRL